VAEREIRHAAIIRAAAIVDSEAFVASVFSVKIAKIIAANYSTATLGG